MPLSVWVVTSNVGRLGSVLAGKKNIGLLDLEISFLNGCCFGDFHPFPMWRFVFIIKLKQAFISMDKKFRGSRSESRPSCEPWENCQAPKDELGGPNGHRIQGSSLRKRSKFRVEELNHLAAQFVSMVMWGSKNPLFFFRLWEGIICLHFVIWGVPKIKEPQNGWFIRKTLLKWMIWGYHYFRKHPYIYISSFLLWWGFTRYLQNFKGHIISSLVNLNRSLPWVMWI